MRSLSNITKTTVSMCSTLILLSLVQVSCGGGTKNKVITKNPAKNTSDGQVADPECVDYTKCPRLTLNLTGRSNLGGAAGNLMVWDMGAIVPQDKRRSTAVVMDNTLPGMDVFSKPTDKILRVNWKPETPQQGELRLRARDMTRCRVLTAKYGGNCDDMSVMMGDFDTVFKTPFQVVAKDQAFNAENSEFFRQFYCDRVGNKEGQVKAAEAGVSILTGAVSDGSNKDQGADISTLIDYFVNGTKKPTPYECYTRNH